MGKKNGKKNGKETGEKTSRVKDYTIEVQQRTETTSLGEIDLDVNFVTFTGDDLGETREFVVSKSGRKEMFAWLEEKRRKSSGRATRNDRLKSAVGLAYKNLMERIAAFEEAPGDLLPKESELLEAVQKSKIEFLTYFSVLERKPRTKKAK